ncbi:MAG: retropepsin-like aspartic protease [Steroidobacteraceae bacterium]
MPRTPPRTGPFLTAALAAAIAGAAALHAREAPPLGTHIAPVEPEQPLYAVSTRLDRVGRIVAPVYVNGQGPLLFMLDTGANRTVLSEEAVRRLGLTPSPGTISVRGVNGRSIAATVVIERLDAGDLRFDHVALPVLAGPVVEQLDGILGMDGLAGKKFTADFVRDRITITKSRGNPAPPDRIVVRGRLISGHLMLIAGHVGSVRVQAVIDTGGTRTLGNTALQRALATPQGPSALVPTTSVVDATERLQLGEFAPAPDIKLGDATISHSRITYGDFDIFRAWGLVDQPAVLIGMDVLGTLAELSIDYRRRELQLLTRGS